MEKMRSLIIFYVLYLAVSSSASADVEIKQHVAIDCLSDEKAPFNIVHEFDLPPLVGFSVGNRWTAGLPLTGKVGNEEKGADNPQHLTIQTSETLLVVAVGKKIVIHLITPRALFCQQATPIETSMTISDRRSERITIRLLPGTSNSTEIDQAAANRKIFNLYGESFFYLLGREQPWLKEFLRSVEDETARRNSAIKFCNGCGWIAQQRLANGLARFLESYPWVLNFPSLGDMGGVFHAPKPEDFKCTYGEAKKGEPSWSTPSDGVLRFVPDTSTNSYLEFRARRSTNIDVVGLEKVVLNGTILGERCE